MRCLYIFMILSILVSPVFATNVTSSSSVTVEEQDGSFISTAIKNAFKAILDFLFDIFQVVGRALFTLFLNAIPPDMIPQVAELADWVGYVDCWFPLTFGLNTLITYYTYLTIFCSVKWLLRICPFVG